MTFFPGIFLFFGAHGTMAVARPLRTQLIERFGEAGYKGIYALVSLAGLVLIYMGWAAAPATSLYYPPYWMRHVAYLFTLLGFIALASAYLPAGRIKAALKHPMLAGLKFWALAHLLVNGEIRSLVVFGAFLAFAVVDRIAVKRRGEPTPAAGPAVNDALAVVAGAAAWASVYFVLHPYIAGVPLR